MIPLRPQPHRLQWPHTSHQQEAVDEMFGILFKAVRIAQTELLALTEVVNNIGSGVGITPTFSNTVIDFGDADAGGDGNGDDWPGPGDNFQNVLTGDFVPYVGAIKNVNLGTFTLTTPTVIGGTSSPQTLTFKVTSGTSGVGDDFIWVTGINGSIEHMRLLRASGTLALGTPLGTDLGSGGSNTLNLHNTIGVSGINISTNLTASGSVLGYSDWGTRATAGAEKRGVAIQAALTASAAASVTADLIIYTTAAGSITEKLRVMSTGTIQYQGRSTFKSTANSLFTFANAAETSGFGVQMGTADTMIVANLAQNAYGIVDALEYRLSATSGLTATVLTFPSRSKITSPANAQLTFANNADASGFGIQMGTADTMIVANKAQNAYGTVDALAYKISAVDFATAAHVINPLIIGGTAVGSSLSLQSTSAIGTTDFIKFLVGNAGATEAIRITHLGDVGIGSTGILDGFGSNARVLTIQSPNGASALPVIEMSAWTTGSPTTNTIAWFDFLHNDSGTIRENALLQVVLDGAVNSAKFVFQTANAGTLGTRLTIDKVGLILLSNKISQYSSINTTGWGVPAIYGTGRSTAQTAAKASVATYTVGAADGSFDVSANVNVTTSTLHNFTVTCDYTDETSTARTLTLSFSQLTGAFVTAITNATGAGPYEGVSLRIRCKASTAITIATVGVGGFTTVTYNVEGSIIQVS